MKILYIITQADGGGAQKYVLSLAKHFRGSIAAGQESQKLFKDAKALGLETFPLRFLKRNINPFWDILALFELIALAKKINPDIIHLNSSKAGFTGSFLKPFVKAKIIFTAHGFVFKEPRAFPLPLVAMLLEKLASKFRDYIICVSNSDRNSALTHKLISEDKISTIHNGLEAINFLNKQEARKKLKLRENEFIIGSLSGFYKTKGLDILIEAISLMSRETLRISKFILVGDGPELLSLKLKIKNLELDDIISTPGKIDSASTYLKAFDLFALPSRKEGFPFALLEAMQAGLPIVASNAGGNHEALGDAGMLVKPADPPTLADAIEILVSDEDVRQTLAKKALERSSIFTEEKMLGETKKIYELVSQKK